MPQRKPDRCLFTASARSLDAIGKAVAVAVFFVVVALVCRQTDFVAADERTSSADDKEKHWSFRPVVEPVVPEGDAARGASPVDRFIRSKLEGVGLKPAAPTEKRTLLRRATYDLTGLPPTPEETRAFLEDESPEAFATVVERLLASPHYGERWGRHWLDVVRYADTAGETADFPAPHAWRYRNWVIDAVNSDKPYDQFLTEQIAGDILASQLPADAPAERFAELVTATGYVSIARRFGYDVDQDHYLTIDDTLDMLGKSVLGLSISCARCHDHKYDPIPAADYYALYGIFESTRYPFPGCEKTKTTRDMVPLMPPARFEQTVKPHQQALADAEAALKKSTDVEAALAKQIKELAAQSARFLAEGQFDNGGSQEIAAAGKPLEHIGVKTGEAIQLTILPRANDGADSTTVEFEIAEVAGQGRRWSVSRDVVPDILAGNPHADSLCHADVWCFLDVRDGPSYLAEGVRDVEKLTGLNGWRRGFVPFALANSTDQPVKPWTVTVPPRSLVLHPSPAGGVSLVWLAPIEGEVTISGRVADADAGGGDGIAWKIEHHAADVAALFVELGRRTRATEELRRKRDASIDAVPKFDVAYAVAEGQPHNARIQRRGDPKSLGDEAPRRFLTVLGGAAVPPDAGSGRMELARWLTDRANPLTARVIVNRIWQHHFGQGLVRTPSDFGLRGASPSHPDLLDYLAARFVASGWSMKWLHRLIMLSKTYQQECRGDPRGKEVDPDNAWLWRFRRRRLSAEEIRDSILAASGDLDRSFGGSHPFPDEKTWAFTQHAPFSAVYDHNRRSVYLMTQRLKRHPFLTLFDGADANASTPDRYTTTVPTQALFFLNDPFIHARSASFAARLMELADDRARLERAFELLFVRPPTEDDHRAAAHFQSEYTADVAGDPEADRPKIAWAAWLRVLMSSNEFVYID
jgi:hypothetical protein